MTKRAKPAKPDLTLAYTDKKGRTKHANLSLRREGIASDLASGSHYISKQAGEDAEDNVATSQAIEDEFNRLMRGRSGTLIQPPFNLRKLCYFRQISTELGQDVDAMVTNTVGFGWSLKERRMRDAETELYADAMEEERMQLEAHLESVHPVDSFTGIMEKVKQDKYQCGNGYVELIDSKQGDLVGLSHVHGHTVRLTLQDQRATRIMVPRVRPDLGFKVEQVPMWHKFRRFVQMRNQKIVWFKEAGDPRMLDKRSGEFTREELPLSRRATSLLHLKTYSPLSPYGVVQWIGNTFSILGSREADETNYVTLLNNAIPSMFVVVENGVLTEKSVERLSEYVEAQIQQDSNMSKFILLEGEVAEDGSPNTGQFRIKIEPLKQMQQTDQMFAQYNKDNRDKIRQSFRLPPILVGRSENYNRATADTSRDIADEQVFAPERTKDDHLINRFILSRWGARFHRLHHKNPNITDDTKLIQLLAIAEKSGAMTPRRADRIVQDVFQGELGPMPTGIDLDKPFTISFAEAQGGSGGGAEPAEAPEPEEAAEKVIRGLVDLRGRLEEALYERWDRER